MLLYPVLLFSLLGIYAVSALPYLLLRADIKNSRSFWGLLLFPFVALIAAWLVFWSIIGEGVDGWPQMAMQAFLVGFFPAIACIITKDSKKKSKFRLAAILGAAISAFMFPLVFIWFT